MHPCRQALTFRARVSTIAVAFIRSIPTSMQREQPRPLDALLTRFRASGKVAEGEAIHEGEDRMTECQVPEKNATEPEIVELLKSAKTVAVVGVSHKEHRDSHRVARYLKEHGYKMIPVNPKYKEVLGETCYPDLRSVPEHIDVVDIFRNMDVIPGVVDEAIDVKAGAVWMQLGLCHNEAADKARSAGLSVVMNKCIKVEHHRLTERKDVEF